VGGGLGVAARGHGKLVVTSMESGRMGQC